MFLKPGVAIGDAAPTLDPLFFSLTLIDLFAVWTTVIVVGGDGHSVGFWLFPRSPAINRTAIKMVTMTPAAKPTISARMIVAT